MPSGILICEPRSTAFERGSEVRNMETFKSICEATYGVNALTADPIVVEWTFDRMIESHGLPAARTALEAINNHRERQGRSGAYPHGFLNDSVVRT